MKSSKKGFRVYWSDYLDIPIGVVLNMRAYKLRRFIGLGTGFRYLQDVAEGWPVHGESAILSNVRAFFRSVEQLRLKVTQQASGDLKKIVPQLEKYKSDQGLSAEHALQLGRIIQALRNTLLAEADTLEAYVLTEKRMDVKRLVEQPESFLGPQTFGKLPSVAQYDIKQAGKCIAFEVPTAAAFHLLRATEDTIRAYYSRFIKQGRKLNPTWGEMITSLRAKRRRPLPNKILLNHLDHIRDSFRNPTDHPEKMYDIDEAQDLFGIVAEVLNRMTTEFR